MIKKYILIGINYKWFKEYCFLILLLLSNKMFFFVIYKYKDSEYGRNL